MKGARFILPGCTGFRVSNPDLGEFRVVRIQHYKAVCIPLGTDPMLAPETFIPFRDFEVLDYPKEICNKLEKPIDP